MLFPHADMNLGDFLKLEQRHPLFTSNDKLYFAMYSLASALDCIHNFNFSSSEVNLTKKGFHHDLKPANILVKGGTFMIADFGLSRLKPGDEDSTTRARKVHPTYLAPECSQSKLDITDPRIGRSAEVWSFGCILSEVATYIVEGADGVNEFKAYRVPQAKVAKDDFHAGGLLKEEVKFWLTRLEKNGGDEHIPPLVDIVRRTLEIEPSNRPNAYHVKQELFHIAVGSSFSCISTRYRELTGATGPGKPPDSLGTALRVEALGHEAWGRVTGLSQLPQGNILGHGSWHPADLVLQQTLTILSKLQAELREAPNIWQVLDESNQTRQSQVRETWRPIEKLGSLNRELCDLLPAELQDMVNHIWTKEVIKTDNFEKLKEIDLVSRSMRRYREINIRAAMKYICLKTAMSVGETDGGTTMRVEKACVRVVPCEGQLTTGWLTEHPDRPRVLIEWKRYDNRWESQVGDEMYQRLGDLAKILSGLDACKPADLRVLDCVAFFHDPSYRFGLVFRFPPTHARAESVDPLSLHEFIVKTRERPRDPRPLLGDLFYLAIAVAESLGGFHNISWFHKNVSSRNILLFPDLITPPHLSVRSPYIAGFDNSRPIDYENFAYTEGPQFADDQDLYQHPEYIFQEDKTRFKQRYDIYSLGVVLLEIGLWKCISEIRKQKDLSELTVEDFHKRLIEKYVPQLGERMGRTYRDAASMCFNGDFGSKAEDTEEGRLLVRLIFQTKVICELRKCFA
jgi:serine/threonine protein kinase